MKKQKRQQTLVRLARSLIVFGRIIAPETAYKASPAFHYDLAHYLQDLQRKYINLVAPRGHAKSSVAAGIFVLWHIFLEDLFRYLLGLSPSPKRRPKLVLLISKTQGEAKRRLTTIKNILGNNENGRYSKPFRLLFGDYGQTTAVRWREDLIELKNGTVIVCLGTGQQSRGFKEDNMRPTLVLVDDPEDEENTKTEERMRANLAWLLQSIIPGLDPDVGRCIVIGTPQNHSCMVVKLHKASLSLDRSGDDTYQLMDEAGDAERWTSRWYGNCERTGTSYWSMDEHMEPREVKPGVLWPEHIPLKKLRGHKITFAELGALGAYYREYESRVVGDDDQLFKPEYFEDTWDGDLLFDLLGQAYLRITHRKGRPLAAPEYVAVNTFVGCDPASSMSARADDTVIFNVAMCRQGHLYWLPSSVGRKMLPTTVVETLAHNDRTLRPRRGLVETVQAQAYIVDYLKRDHGIYYWSNVTREKKKGADSRLEKLEPQYRAGKVHPHPSMDPARRQFLNYPRGKDDWMDAYDFAQKIAFPATHEVVLDQQHAARRKTRKTYDPMLA